MEDHANWTLASDLDSIDWLAIAELYKNAPLFDRNADEWRRAFEASSLVCFARETSSNSAGLGPVVGVGRALTDGVLYGAIYDVAVDCRCQNGGIGQAIVTDLLSRLPLERVYLTAAPGKQGFYGSMGFMKLNNAMGYYAQAPRARAMELGIMTTPDPDRCTAECKL
jgi:ribosomal protein S18 acetylase RimI-like enzyme